MSKVTVNQPVIKTAGLAKHYGYGDAFSTALNGIDLEIDKGEFVAIMGPSGCGKTTLLNILGLLDHPTDGTYQLDGKHAARLTHGARARIRSRQIGFVFQSFNLLPRMNIVENVALPLTYTWMTRTSQLNAASRMLKTFGLHEREYYMPHQLSGGQLQRVAIARALVNKPSIILADEPTGNLDSKSSELIMNELREIHERGNTIIMVTHNPDLTVYATRIIHMRDGQIETDTKHQKPAPKPKPKPLVPFSRKTSRQAKAAAKVASKAKAKKPTKSSKKKSK